VLCVRVRARTLCGVAAGSLATGDCKGFIYLWDVETAGTLWSWKTDRKPFVSHKDSVEDIQFSPVEPGVRAWRAWTKEKVKKNVSHATCVLWRAGICHVLG